MTMLNAVAEVFAKTNDDMRLREIISNELRGVKSMIITQLKEIQMDMMVSQNNTHIDYGPIKELSKKIDQLHLDVRNLDKSCDSLYKALCKFK